jgi:hypothetical protein
MSERIINIKTGEPVTKLVMYYCQAENCSHDGTYVIHWGTDSFAVTRFGFALDEFENSAIVCGDHVREFVIGNMIQLSCH